MSEEQLQESNPILLMQLCTLQQIHVKISIKLSDSVLKQNQKLEKKFSQLKATQGFIQEG